MTNPELDYPTLLVKPSLGSTQEVPDASIKAMSLDPEEFPKVDLLERNAALIASLELLASTTDRIGMKKAAGSATHRPGLEKRYGPKTDEVVAGSSKKFVRPSIPQNFY